MCQLYTGARTTKLRKEPHADGEVVGELPQGTPVDLVQRGERFSLVTARHPELGQISGYAHNSFLQGAAPPRALEKSPKPEVRCRACGGTEWSTVPTHHRKPADFGSIPYAVLGLLHSVQIKARICMACGLVEPCLDGEGLEMLRAHLRS
ncbi:MAG: SH3 domain-containing protein [Bacillota bacterium]